MDSSWPRTDGSDKDGRPARCARVISLQPGCNYGLLSVILCKTVFFWSILHFIGLKCFIALTSSHKSPCLKCQIHSITLNQIFTTCLVSCSNTFEVYFKVRRKQFRSCFKSDLRAVDELPFCNVCNWQNFRQEHPRLNSALRLYSVKLVSISRGFLKEARAVDPTDIRFRLLLCEL